MRPLIIASTEGFEVVVDLLLRSNADINIQDNVCIIIEPPLNLMCVSLVHYNIRLELYLLQSHSLAGW